MPVGVVAGKTLKSIVKTPDPSPSRTRLPACLPAYLSCLSVCLSVYMVEQLKSVSAPSCRRCRKGG